MKQGKDVKTKENPSRDPDVAAFRFDEFHQNILALTDGIKSYLMSEGLDWRFVNANQYRSGGNFHRAKWKPYAFRGKEQDLDLVGALNAEGYIQRGDLILAVRPKKVTEQHRAFLDQRNNLYSGYNREKAKELKDMARTAGVKAKIHEGYDEND